MYKLKKEVLEIEEKLKYKGLKIALNMQVNAIFKAQLKYLSFKTNKPEAELIREAFELLKNKTKYKEILENKEEIKNDNDK